MNLLTETELDVKMEGIEHLLSPGQAYWLYRKVFELSDNAAVLEIGCYKGGGSTLAMALACVETHRRIYVVDCHQEYVSEARSLWAKLDVINHISIVVSDSAKLPDIIVSESWPPFDFAFIDGSHDFFDIAVDVHHVMASMKAGARIALHDVTEAFPGVEAVWKQLSTKLQNHEHCITIASGTIAA